MAEPETATRGEDDEMAGERKGTARRQVGFQIREPWETVGVKVVRGNLNTATTGVNDLTAAL